MSWVKQYWYYIFSFILGGVIIFSDRVMYFIAFGGFFIVLILGGAVISYWIPRLVEYSRYRKCNHIQPLKKATICIFLLFIGPVFSASTSNLVLELYGNYLIEKIEEHKIQKGNYPKSLSDVGLPSFTSNVYYYSSKNKSFYLSFKSRALVRKYKEGRSEQWSNSVR